MRPEAGHSMMARRSSVPGRVTPTMRRGPPGRPRGRPQCKRRTRMQRDRTSRPGSRANAPSPNRPTCNGGRHRLCRSRCERKCRAQTRDEAGKEVLGAPSCGRSQTVLYNEERPHSKLGWMTPRDYAGSIRGETGRHAAQPDGFARRPLATPTNEGSDQPRTLIIAG
jgi:hypothetical protein